MVFMESSMPSSICDVSANMCLLRGKYCKVRITSLAGARHSHHARPDRTFLFSLVPDQPFARILYRSCNHKSVQAVQPGLHLSVLRHIFVKSTKEVMA
jgi:hypothetical protein